VESRCVGKVTRFEVSVALEGGPASTKMKPGCPTSRRLCEKWVFDSAKSKAWGILTLAVIPTCATPDA
jgi:hypothetical protein